MLPEPCPPSPPCAREKVPPQKEATSQLFPCGNSVQRLQVETCRGVLGDEALQHSDELLSDVASDDHHSEAAGGERHEGIVSAADMMKPTEGVVSAADMMQPTEQSHIGASCKSAAAQIWAQSSSNVVLEESVDDSEVMAHRRLHNVRNSGAHAHAQRTHSGAAHVEVAHDGGGYGTAALASGTNSHRRTVDVYGSGMHGSVVDNAPHLGEHNGASAAHAAAMRLERAERQQRLDRLERRTHMPLRKLHSRLQAAAYTKDGQDWGLLFQILDKDHSGKLSLDELIRAVRRELHVPAAEMADEMVEHFFKLLDIDASGEIGVAELVRFLQQGMPAEVPIAAHKDNAHEDNEQAGVQERSAADPSAMLLPSTLPTRLGAEGVSCLDETLERRTRCDETRSSHDDVSEKNFDQPSVPCPSNVCASEVDPLHICIRWEAPSKQPYNYIVQIVTPSVLDDDSAVSTTLAPIASTEHEVDPDYTLAHSPMQPCVDATAHATMYRCRCMWLRLVY